MWSVFQLKHLFCRMEPAESSDVALMLQNKFVVPLEASQKVNFFRQIGTLSENWEAYLILLHYVSV